MLSSLSLLKMEAASHIKKNSKLQKEAILASAIHSFMVYSCEESHFPHLCCKMRNPLKWICNRKT